MFYPEAIPSEIAAAAIAPACFALWLVATLDAWRRPPILVWTAFILGIGSIFILHYTRQPFARLADLPGGPWVELFRHVVFAIAVPEELAKIFVIAALSFNRRAVENPMDSVVYGAAVGLGFAAYENVAYLLQQHDDWETLAIIRSVLTVPFHGALGIIAGAYIAAARYGFALGARRHNDRSRTRTMASIVLVPVVLHSLFDIPLVALRDHMVSDYTGLFQAAGLIVGFGTIAIAVRLILRLLLRSQPTAPGTPLETWNWRLWGTLALAAAAGFGGLVLTLSGERQLNTTSAPSSASFSFSVAGHVGIGVALLILASALFVRARNHIRKNTSLADRNYRNG